MRYKRKVRKKEISDEENSCQKDLYIKPFLTPLEVSEILGVSISTVYRYFYTCTIKAVHLRKKTTMNTADYKSEITLPVGLQIRQDTKQWHTACQITNPRTPIWISVT